MSCCRKTNIQTNDKSEITKLNDCDSSNNIFSGGMSTFIKAIKTQNSPYKWFIGGIHGLLKCTTGKTCYSDENIIQNREICKN